MQTLRQGGGAVVRWPKGGQFTATLAATGTHSPQIELNGVMVGDSRGLSLGEVEPEVIPKHTHTARHHLIEESVANADDTIVRTVGALGRGVDIIVNQPHEVAVVAQTDRGPLVLRDITAVGVEISKDERVFDG